jgi:hypothetical protein
VRGQAADDPAHPGSRKTGTRSGVATRSARFASEMAAKRETTMSTREGPSGGGVNPMLETRVLDWILSDSDVGPSSGKEERAGEGSTKWARGLPHVCEHNCLATTKRCRGSSE